MLTEVKNLFKISFLSTKYAIMREMENKVAFIMNVLFMVLNNASFILVWVVMYSIKDNINSLEGDRENSNSENGLFINDNVKNILL